MPRDDAWFDTLKRWLGLERTAERARLAQDKAELPLPELAARGLVLLDVESTDESVGLGGRHLVTFKDEQKRPPVHSLLARRRRHGGPEEGAPRRAPGGIVTSSTRTSLTVAFERPPPPWMAEGRLRIDLLVQRRHLRAHQRRAGDLEVLRLGRRSAPAETSCSAAPPPRFEPTERFEASRPLNPEQLAAVSLALRARDVALVHGPPGHWASRRCWRRSPRSSSARASASCARPRATPRSITCSSCASTRASTPYAWGTRRACCPTSSSTPSTCLVEEHPDRVLARELFDEAFELLGYARRQRTQGRSRQRFANAREAQAEARKLMDDARALERKALASVMGGASVVVCATLAALDGSVLSGHQCDVALLDEATQATEPLALIAFLKASIVILAGDPLQLGPTVLSVDAAKAGLGTSLFERLLAEYGGEVKQLLKEQYRMHEGLMRFPSKEFYAGELRAHPAVAGHTLAELLAAPVEGDFPPLLFLDTAGKGFDEAKAPGTESLLNEGEAGLIEARVRELLAAGLLASQLAVITPYSAQAALLRERLSRRGRARGGHGRRLPGPGERGGARLARAQQRGAVARVPRGSPPAQRRHHPPATPPLRGGRLGDAVQPPLLRPPHRGGPGPGRVPERVGVAWLMASPLGGSAEGRPASASQRPRRAAVEFPNAGSRPWVSRRSAGPVLDVEAIDAGQVAHVGCDEGRVKDDRMCGDGNIEVVEPLAASLQSGLEATEGLAHLVRPRSGE